jgi:hypothetical protein
VDVSTTTHTEETMENDLKERIHALETAQATQAAAAAGVSRTRYPVLWHRVERAPLPVVAGALEVVDVERGLVRGLERPDELDRFHSRTRGASASTSLS